MPSTFSLIISTLLPLSTTAHFVLNWPPSRGFEDSSATNFPCGGFDSVKPPRTEWPIKGGPVQLRMHHPQTRVKVFMALGDDPGTSFNVVLREQFAQEGLGNFCVGGLSVPEGVNVSDGMSATIQVVTNGDPEGGLYQTTQCADVKLVNTVSEDLAQHCNNGTIKITEENIKGNPNETSSSEPAPSGSSPSEGAPAATTSAPAPGMAAQHLTAVSWLLGVVGVVGFAML
ncbi:uncharacterized protein EI97DRAFT_368152 [Westerdykella ornata]|uniref:Copper acquisition factor BIM1-like domain-containing protein n=1 Tax=Westerdykella ornata TaxID=318751 RepID=A0A6A6JZW1_WESOR|nr:uncharacterized protein EI97DRAFT_368152 [Westerdykella ornata]KAF2281408.1 hypothetical protein EI97DRAFT_368152 [Westerdykella ornata]